jgi:REP element-mobilizing transposase RayT
MPNELRFIPEETTVFELTARTVAGCMAFVPTQAMVQEWIGLLSEACARWPTVQVHQICILSNHFHMLSSVRGAHRIEDRGRWASFVHAGAARLAQRQTGLRGRIWARRYRAIPVLGDAAIRDRSRYVMAQAVRAGLVAKPNQWLGLNCADALCRGAALTGYYTTAASRRQARRAGVPDVKTAETRRLVLAPLPGHTNWTEAQRQTWYRHIERKIIDEEKARNAREGGQYPTRSQLLSVSPTSTVELPTTPAPKAHVGQGNRARYTAWVEAKRAFVALWRQALARWVDGEPPRFPSGGWVPFRKCSRRLSRILV